MSYLNSIEQKEVNDALNTIKQVEQFQNDPNINQIFFKKYKVIKKIAEGTFGLIYEGINIKTNKPIAIKLEERSQYNILEQEGYILFTVKGFGIVELLSFGRNRKYNIMIQPLLGDSIYKVFLNCKKKFTIKDICLIGLQCLDRIEWIHTKNIIHRDIKPENFLFDRKDPRIIYMIDFGLSKKYRSERTMKHIQFCLTKNLTGTARYASVNALKGFELSRRDDLESFCYMIIFFLMKKLPWQGIKAQTQAKRYKKICDIKEMFKIDNYKKIIPLEIIKIFKYVKKLKFDEEPNYDKIRNLFKHLLSELNYKDNDTFSWIVDKRILKLKKSIDIHRRKSSYKKRLLENIGKTESLFNYSSFSPLILHKNNQFNNTQSSQAINSEIIRFNQPNFNKNEIIKKINFEDTDFLNNHNLSKKIEINNNNNEPTCTSRKACLEYNIDEVGSKIHSLHDHKYKRKKNNSKNNIIIKFNNSEIDGLYSNNRYQINANSASQIQNINSTYNVVTTDTNDSIRAINKKKVNEYYPKFAINSTYNNIYKRQNNNNNKSKIKKNLNTVSITNSNREFYLSQIKKDKNIGNFVYDNLNSFYNHKINYKSIFDKKK